MLGAATLVLFGAAVLHSAAGGSMQPYALSHLIRFGVFLVAALVGLPAILAAFGLILWTRGFGPEDRELFRMRKADIDQLRIPTPADGPAGPPLPRSPPRRPRRGCGRPTGLWKRRVVTVCDAAARIAWW